MNSRLILVAVCIVPVLLGASAEPSADDSIWDKFKDPKDGSFDMSLYHASRHGFLPVPIIFTESAGGYGGGLFVVFYHVNA
jgi:hypothetical protein